MGEDYLPGYGLTAGALAKAMGLRDRTGVERLVRERQPVTADTALRLALVFGTSAQFWINLQSHYDLAVEEDHLGKSLEREVHVFAGNL